MSDGIFKEEAWAKLERPERLKHLNPHETLVRLGLKAGDRFADLGSGTGVFVLPALALVGESGAVYAVERSQKLIDRMLAQLPEVPETLKVVQQDLMALKWQGAPVDKALLCHVAHELPDLVVFLSALRGIMAPGGRLAVIEWQAKEQPQGPPLHKRLSEAQMTAVLTDSGWEPELTEPLGEDYYLICASVRGQ